MKPYDKTIQRLLLERNILSKEQVERAVLLAPSLGKSFVDTLIFKNLVSEDVLGQIVGEAAGVGYASLKGRIVPPEVLGLLTEDVAAQHHIIPFAQTPGEIHVAMADPSDFGIINFLEKKTGLAVRPYFTFDSQIQIGLSQYKTDIKTEFAELLAAAKQNVANPDLSKVAEEAPTIKMLETIMDYALAEGASDIHIEGQETNILIRFRIDGILRDVLILDMQLLPAIVARIKYLSNLKIDEHRLPQDGRFKYVHNISAAVRVSIIPSFYGENVVMRLLPETERAMTLAELGFSPRDTKVVDEEIKRTNGIILVTGPTGSGKSTTLYSLLEILNKPEVKITTIEDPIEYGIPRVSQIQVNNLTGLTFANGLRSLLRHDPNILMVGEIRDKETADISINAALTGHLVLSTLHTNDAPSAIPRMLDLGIEPFLISATLRMVAAQRLVRRLCPKCAVPDHVSDEVLQSLSRMTGFALEELKQKQFYAAHGCAECRTGYKGRFVIGEVFQVDDEIGERILKRPSNEDVRRLAIKNGMYTMIQDGIAKAAAGMTTINEVLREIRE